MTSLGHGHVTHSKTIQRLPRILLYRYSFPWFNALTFICITLRVDFASFPIAQILREFQNKAGRTGVIIFAYFRWTETKGRRTRRSGSRTLRARRRARDFVFSRSFPVARLPFAPIRLNYAITLRLKCKHHVNSGYKHLLVTAVCVLFLLKLK